MYCLICHSPDHITDNHSAALRVQGGKGAMKLWEKEFSEDFRPEQAILDCMERDGISDQSYHNDACPHIERVSPSGGIACLYFEHRDSAQRETGPSRYFVTLTDPETFGEPMEEDAQGNDLRALATDDADEAVRYFLAL